MSTFLILILLLVVLAGAASFVLGQATYEVENARVAEYVEIDGVCVRYRVSGAGPPVLLVHGWLSSSLIWERIAERLASGFTVYSLDLKGFGDSDKPQSGYGVRQGSRLLYAFCAHFELTGVGVVGHGIGGDMAVKFAVDHPNMVGGLALVSSPAKEDQVDLPTPLWLSTLPLFGPIFFALMKYAPFWRRLGMRPFVLEREDVEDRVLEDAAKPTPSAFRKTFAAIGREVADGKLLRQARRIRVPALLIAGEEDQIVDPRSVESWGESISRTEASFIEDCGHLPMIERPEELASSLAGFLSELPETIPEDSEPPEGSLFTIDGEQIVINPPPKRQGSVEEARANWQDETGALDERVPEDEADKEARKRAKERERAQRQQPLGLPDDLFEWPEKEKPARRRSRDEREDPDSE